MLRSALLNSGWRDRAVMGTDAGVVAKAIVRTTRAPDECDRQTLGCRRMLWAIPSVQALVRTTAELSRSGRALVDPTTKTEVRRRWGCQSS
jgi:hypothetical protein